MTINATAMWLLALYVSVAQEQGVPLRCSPARRRTTSSRSTSPGTYIFPPDAVVAAHHRRRRVDGHNCPKWNPVNICSYHLQEAGATPVQEVGFALATAVAVLDAVRDSGQVPAERMSDVVARISFFVNAGVRFVEEMRKMRAFAALWDEITGRAVRRERRGRPSLPLRRTGELARAHGGAAGEQPAAHRAGDARRHAFRDARARAVQLPAWNEALGLPRPWDQQWSLRIQQVLAYESDLLEYPDLFEGRTWSRR